MIMIKRRSFLKGGLGAGLISVLTPLENTLMALPNGNIREVPPIQDSQVRELISTGLNAAREAGATYADVRLTLWREMMAHPMSGGNSYLDASVRALVDGYWGFAASCFWEVDELARIDRHRVFHSTPIHD